jgi:hypothetical protein
MLLAVPANLAAQIKELKKPEWSVSLESEGYHRPSPRQDTLTVIGDIAATEKVVGVLLCTRGQHTDEWRWSGPWTIYLLLHDAQSGQFLSRKGPWASGEDFRLSATPSGQLILFVSPITDGYSTSERHFILLSPKGKEINSLHMTTPVASPAPKSTSVVLSPTAQTALLLDRWATETRYRLLDLDTLAVKKDWTEQRGNPAFEVISISDEWMLGRTIDGSDPKYAVRKFEGSWRELPKFVPTVSWYSFESSAFARDFVGDEKIVGRAFERKNQIVLPVYNVHGVLDKEYTGPKPGFHSSPSPLNPLSSSDGRYLGLRCMGENAVSYWWAVKMDMWAVGTSYFLYIWHKDFEAAVARIKVSPGSANAAFFAGREAKITVIDGSNLKLFTLPTRSSTN